MDVIRRLPLALGVVVLAWSTGGCGSSEQGTASCLIAATIAFDGREYIAVGSLPSQERDEVRIGERLGTGERATCPGDPVQQVQVYRLAGVPVGRAVWSEPEFGLMHRWNRDGTIQ